MLIQHRSKATRPHRFSPHFIFTLVCSLLLLLSNVPKAQAGPPIWTAAPPMANAREFFTMTVLQNGKVLVAGGDNPSGILASAEIYDPTSNMWSAAASMTNMRRYHTATLLQNGQVLVVGGYGNPYDLSTAELYDPVLNIWTATSSMSTARLNHTATLLSNGKVLVTGGQSGSTLASAELYNPATYLWSSAGSMSTPRVNHQAILLGNGKVLVMGGLDNSGLPVTSAELYDPNTNSWSSAGSMITNRENFGAVLLNNGKALVEGGDYSGGTGCCAKTNAAEIYDPSGNSWSAVAPMNVAHARNIAVLLGSGNVLVAGGETEGGTNGITSTSEWYDPTANTWSILGPLLTAEQSFQAVLLGNGKVLASGGDDSNGTTLANAELFSYLNPTNTPTVTNTPTNTPTPTATSTPPPPPKDTIGVKRLDQVNNQSRWLLRLANSTGYANFDFDFGGPTSEYPVVGDWNGDGVTTVGVVHQTDGIFQLRDSNTNGNPDYTFVLGNSNDMPIAGHWDNSIAHDGVGVFRPSNGLIYLKDQLVTGYADFQMVLGIPGDQGLAGDWDGNGFDSPGVYRPSNSGFYLSNKVCNCSVYADYAITYGIGGDSPVVGDWTGQGHDGIGLFRQSNGYTYLKNQLTTGYADLTFTYGIAGDVPVAGHWQAGSYAPPPADPGSVLVPPGAVPVPFEPTNAVPSNGIGD